ncbi:glycosyl transferase, group 1 family protein [Oleiphilus messinensis]|uniref:Glycosyl transferase, group 1 family protein n=1 Tax=Oleiphilus messinensis TaxID=141451 RepID=A0A1Y0IJ07_9GAMM|nr:glycosyltransferase family 4 protein [Oleiphilus messinensis]ARU59505.1 glycosyl transferase, group 1 family protein [Oleiphilus messinensis]
MTKLLVIGPLPISGDKVGGTKVNFSNFIQWLDNKPQFETLVINTSRPLLKKATFQRHIVNRVYGINIISKIALFAQKSDFIVLNVSVNGLTTLFPKVYRISKFFKKPLIVRVFGGDFDTYIEDRLSSERRIKLLQMLQQLPVVFLQTRSLCKRAGSLLSNIEQLSNSRDIQRTARPLPEQLNRFLFFSEVKPSKGIFEALKASDTLPSNCRLDIYGQLNINSSIFDNHSKAYYCGIVPSTRTASIMSEYDALIFPSYFSGEGIPGTILEALQVGLPVIATNWRDIPEVVSHEINGLIVPPKDWKALSTAMNKLVKDRVLYKNLVTGALRSGDEYRSEKCFSPLIHRLSSIQSNYN